MVRKIEFKSPIHFTKSDFFRWGSQTKLSPEGVLQTTQHEENSQHNPSSQIIRLSSLYRQAEVVSQTINESDRSVELVWTTGHRDLRVPFLDEPFFEELSVSKDSVRLDRLNNGANLIDSHDDGSVRGVLGVVQKAWVDGGKGFARVRFSERPDVEGIWQDVKSGIIRNVSVRYRVHKFTEDKREGEKFRTFTAVDWEPMELSLVSVPFDPNSQIRSQQPDQYECKFVFHRGSDFHTSTQKGDLDMSQENLETSEGPKTGEPKAGELQPREPQTRGEVERPSQSPKASQVDVDLVKTESRNAGIESERKRVTEIRRSTKATRLTEAFADDLIERGVSVEECRKLIIDEWAKVDTTQTNNQVEVIQDAGDKRLRSVGNALLHRYDSSKYKLEEGQDYRGMSLLRLAEDFVGKSRGLTNPEIALRAMHSTSDFPILLSNITGKTLRDAFTFQPRRFMPIVRTATLNDYKPVTRIQFGAAPSLEEVKEGGEYTFGTVSEYSESYKLAKYGKVISITEETIINDDLNAFMRLATMFGSAAARLESRLVWSIFLDNPGMSDGSALFDASHGNLGTAAAISDTSLDEARQYFRSQKDKDGLDYLDLEPLMACLWTSQRDGG